MRILGSVFVLYNIFIFFIGIMLKFHHVKKKLIVTTLIKIQF
jgi:hypothetical protein